MLDFQAAQSVEGNAAQDTAVPSTENGKSALEHQPEVGDSKDVKNTPPTDHSEAPNGVDVAGHVPDPAAVASQLATEAAAAQEEAQKV